MRREEISFPVAARTRPEPHLCSTIGDDAGENADPPVQSDVRLDRSVGRGGSDRRSSPFELETNVGVAKVPVLLERLG